MEAVMTYRKSVLIVGIGGKVFLIQNVRSVGIIKNKNNPRFKKTSETA